MDVSEEHLAKAHLPIVVTELGSVMDVSEEHLAKALSPIVVSESGSVMDVSQEHSLKARAPIVVAPAGTTIDTILRRFTPSGRTTLPSSRSTASQRMLVPRKPLGSGYCPGKS
jgi:hypothetical protein